MPKAAPCRHACLRSLRAVLAATGLLPGALFAQEAAGTGAGAGAPEQAPAASRPWLRGQLRSQYWFRDAQNSQDHDLFEVLTVDFGDADRDTVTGHFMGRLAWDLDGYDRTFSSINDSYGDRVDFLLYDAYLDFHRIEGLAVARLGRQSVWDTPVFAYFDGAHVTSDPLGSLALQFGGYLGVSNHLYEASATGDLTGGVYAQARPWTGGRVRLDYMHLEDETRLRSHVDDLYGVGVWQTIGESWQLDAQYTRLGSEDRDVRGRVTFRAGELDLLVQGSYYGLLTTQGDLVLELDPFYNSLNELRPFDEWTLLVSKGLFEVLTLDAGLDLRRVRDDADVGVYNRNFDHYYGTLTWNDLGTKGLSLGGTVDFWDSDDQVVQTWGFDLEYRLPRSRIAAGSYYSMYKFDLFSNTERDHVRTYFARLRYDAGEATTLECDYEIENDDFDFYHRLRLGVVWRF